MVPTYAQMRRALQQMFDAKELQPRTRYPKPPQEGEQARRRRQIAKGMLTESNGLVRG